jgi:hypothetical protein
MMMESLDDLPCLLLVDDGMETVMDELFVALLLLGKDIVVLAVLKIYSESWW